MREKLFSKPFDKAHSILFNGAPAEYTSVVEVPGIFVEKINRMVHLKDGTGGEMDAAYIADPDYELLFERATVAFEHQSKPVSDEKMDKFGDYDTQMVVDHHLPTLICVACKISPYKSRDELKRTPSDITKPYYLDLSEENIYKRLNMVEGIINSNKYLSRENALNLGVIVLFAPQNHACEVTERVVNLYIKISDDLDFKMELILFSVIILMIDAYFDEENDFKRLMNMMNNNTSSEVIDEFSPFDGFRESLDYADRRISQLEEENSELEAENSRIPELEARIKELENQIYGK